MNASDLLCDQWRRQVKEIFASLHAYQQEMITLGILGIAESGIAVMQRVAETLHHQLESDTKAVSYERRLQRFVVNERIEVKTCWEKFLSFVLPFWRNKPVTLIVDLTPYTQEATIVYLGIVVQSRVLPLAWCVMPQQETWDRGQWEIVGELFEQVAGFLTSSDCTLLADRGLSCLNLIKLCEKVHWHYVLRIKNDEWFRKKYRHFYQDWQQGKQMIKKEGDQWYGEVLLWQEHQLATNLSACWEPGYKEPWFLISDRRASHQRVAEYGKRMKVEATFQDQKGRGYMIECSRFKNRDHLDRWLLLVYLAIWWITHLGSSCIHHGHREQIDRKDRRDKGLLRIGHLWLQEILKKANRDLRPETRNRIAAQLANCLPFSHRKRSLCFSIYLR
jgi:Transposase DDE domain